MSLPLSHAGGSVDGISAALDLRFASSLSLTSTSGITPSFSRASTGTFFNSSGVLTTAPVNGPRFNHVYNGSSWVSKGLLVEEQRTNLCTYSSNQLNAAWVPFNSTITASGETDPVGGTSAFRIAETTTSNQRHIAYNTITPSAATFTYSVFAKAQERNWLQLISFDDPNLYYTWFNLSTGVVGTNAAGNTATITAVGNGWYRCSVTRTVASTGAQYIQTGPANGDNNSAYAGDPTKGLLVYGAQVEIGSFPTSYIPTVASSVTRSADVCQITGSAFTNLWNATEGSFACEVDSFGGNTIANQAIVTANDGTFANVIGQIRNLQNTIGDYGAFCRASNTNTMSISRAAGSTQAGVAFKVATGFKANDCADSLNGGAVITDSSVTIPTVNRITIGDFHTGANTILNGHIARLRYFNKRLTNKQLEDLCKPEQQLKLDLNFSSSLSLTPTVGPTPSYSRASTGTYFNASGVLTSAAINGPRFDHVYDGTNWVSKGLLIEEQRTNLATYSEDFSNAAYGISGVTVLANQVAAPDGNTTADKLTMTSSGTFYQSPFYGSAGAQAGSVWLRADSTQTVMLRIANDSGGESTTSTVTVTTSWQRFSVVRTFAANPIKIWFGIDQRSILGGPNVAATIYGWGYQIESGAFPTSYIPTTTATVTRSADVCQITGGDFSGLWNLSAGTIVVEEDSAVPPSLTGGAFLIWLANGTPELYYYYRGGDNYLAVDNVVRKVVISTPSANTRLNTAIAFTASDFAASVNGASVTTSANLTMPVGPTIFQIGGYTAGNQMICGHIARLRYYPTRLPNATLQVLST